jgi:hypothetical protein
MARVTLKYLDTDYRAALWLLRRRYGKPRASAETLFRIAVAEVVQREARKVIQEDGYAPLAEPSDNEGYGGA